MSSPKRDISRYTLLLEDFNLPAIAPVITVIAITATTSTSIAVSATVAIPATRTACLVVKSTRRTLGLETITAIDGAIFTRNKRNSRLATTRCTRSFVLLARLTRSTRGILQSASASGTAGWAATGLVGQSFAGVEILFTSGKCKFITTISAYKDAVPVALIKHHGFPFPLLKITLLK